MLPYINRRNKLKSDRAQFSSDYSSCKHCVLKTDDNIVHVLFVCQFSEDKRREHYDSIRRICPNGMTNSFFLMNYIERCNFLLSAFGCEYIVEWNDIYTIFLDFMYTMYHNHVQI